MKDKNETLLKELENQRKSLDKRIDNAVDKFGEVYSQDLDIEELRKTFNPNNEHKMVKLEEFIDKNCTSCIADIEAQMIMQQLELQNFIKTVNDGKKEGIILVKPPYTYYCIEPTSCEDDNYIYITTDIALSDVVCDIMQEYVDEFFSDEYEE